MLVANECFLYKQQHLKLIKRLILKTIRTEQSKSKKIGLAKSLFVILNWLLTSNRHLEKCI